MKIALRLLFTFFIFLAFSNNVYATHLLGADLQYECLGPGQYRVTMTLYRDCNGVTPSGSQNLSYSSATCNVSGSIQLASQGPPADITPLCPSVPSACGGSGNYGIQQWTYSGILNLPPGCGADWVLGWSQCCRNNAINTLNGPGSQNMYVGSLLDNTITPVCNSSPTFNNAPGSILCVNQPVVYNHGVSDIDNDSLYFSLGNCYQANGSSVNYNGGFNATSPLSTTSGVSINSSTGALSFTPSAQQVGVLCVNVKEYRNGVLIGEINRDMQFTVIACSNVPPQASGVNGAPNTSPVNFETSICANGDLCFTIDGSDPNGNNVTMSWNNEIIGGSFVVTNNGTTNPTAEFCWSPGPNDIGQNVFTVNVEDDACPIIGQGTYTYIVDVLPSPNTLSAGPSSLICYGDSITLTATSSPAALSYSWSPAAGLSSTTGASVIASPLVSSNYIVQATFPDGCDLSAVVSVGVRQNPTISVSPSNTFTCSGQQTTLTAVGPNITSYLWSPGGQTTSSIDVSPTSTTTYTVVGTDNGGCSNSSDGTVVIAAPTGNVCNVLYVTPTGSPNGIGTKLSPMDLETALEEGACNGTVVKMAIGDYVTDTVINRVTSYITLEGGFDPTINWDKVSTAGGTRILRTATQSYSLISGSIVMGSGIVNESGPNPEVVAISVANQTGFRFQDLTVETELISPGTTMASYDGPDVVAVRLNSCDQYNMVRTQAIADNGGNGSDEIWSIPATDGGNSRAFEIFTNGAGGNLIQVNASAGSGGTAGLGPILGNGSAGSSNNVFLTGTALSTNNSSFNLAGQPIITMDDIACTETVMDFSQTTSSNWTFGAGSSPPSAVGNLVSTQYSNLGRKDINYGANQYTGFANIILDAQIIPNFTTDAPFIQGQYRVCAGSTVNFAATNGGVGYIYHWDLGGGASPNNYDGPGLSNLNSILFPTPGIYTIELQFETNCCGLSIPYSIELYVEEYPSLSITPNQVDLCYGETNPVALFADDSINGGSISWSPPFGLNYTDSFNVLSLPSDSIMYNVFATDSTGLCASFDSVVINVIDLNLSTSFVNASCGPNGSASVTVTGGSGLYTYLWDDPANQTTATANNLAVGIYQVIVTDANLGCQDSIDVVINPTPGSLVGFLSNVNPVSCNGNSDGTATVSITGGVAPFDYVWDPPAGSTLGTTATSDTTPMLPGGTYDVLITDDAGCTYTVSAFIAEPDSLIVEPDSLYNPTCIGASDGYLSIFVDGAVGPYTIIWDDPDTTVGYVIDSLGVGTYCAYVSDANGCLDSMCFTLSAPLLTDSVFDTICFMEAYTLPGGQLINPMSDTSSVDSLVNSIGCDSIVSTFLTIIPPKASTIDTTICFGESILVNGNLYDSTVIGAMDTAFNIGPFNCDSIVTINLNVQDFIIDTVDTTICQGQSFTFNGQTYSQNGLYYDTTFYTGTGCDSVQYLINLNIDSFVVDSLDTTICQGQNLTVNGVTYATSGIFYDTAYYAISGCDSVQFVIDLEVANFTIDSTDTTLCEGQSITINGIPYNSPGLYYDTLSHTNSSCDSIQFVIDLQIDTISNTLVDTTICQGDTLTVNGVSYTATGIYIDTSYHNPSGCIDEIFTIDLTVTPLPNVVANSSIASNSSCVNNTISVFGSGTPGVGYVWDNGVVDNISFSPSLGQTDYVVTGTDALGCVSWDTITITGHPTYLDTVTTSICEDQNYTLPDGSIINTAGSYPVTLTSNQNCDSTIVTNLSINYIGTFQAIDDVIVCDGLAETLSMTATNMVSYEWFVNDGSGNQSLVGNSDYLGATSSELSFNLDTSLHLNTYSVQMVDECGNAYSDEISVEVYSPHLVANPINDTTFCLHEIDVITVDYDGYDYEWNNGAFGPSITPDVSGEYIVNFVENRTNCLMSDTIQVLLEDCIANCVVLAPTGFSPNASGMNDLFRVVTTCEEGFSSFEFYIYNRWGELVYNTDDWREGWDGNYQGKQAEIGTYTYYVEYTKELTNKKEILSGNVSLIR